MGGVYGDKENPMLFPPQVGVACRHHRDIECLMPALSPAVAVDREPSNSRLNFKCRFQGLNFFGHLPVPGAAKYLSNYFSLHDAYRPLLPIPRLVRVLKAYE